MEMRSRGRCPWCRLLTRRSPRGQREARPPPRARPWVRGIPGTDTCDSAGDLADRSFLQSGASSFLRPDRQGSPRLSFVNYLKRTCAAAEPGSSIYPYIIPIRNADRPPRDLSFVRATTPSTLLRRSMECLPRARGAVDCALTAARSLLQGYRLAYALVRPPGHHAERRAFGGFCYLNSTAIAAHYPERPGPGGRAGCGLPHGNGTQEIFYERSDVLTVSLHGHPRFAYPYFTGFADERGRGDGDGYNLNLRCPRR